MMMMLIYPIVSNSMDQLFPYFPILYGLFQLFYAVTGVSFEGM